MVRHVIAVRRWIDALEVVANTSPADPREPFGPVEWIAANELENHTELVFATGERERERIRKEAI
jgi:hypothetical protein